MDWPTAFAIAALIISTFAYLGWTAHLRAEVMREAIRSGADRIKFD